MIIEPENFVFSSDRTKSYTIIEILVFFVASNTILVAIACYIYRSY